MFAPRRGSGSFSPLDKPLWLPSVRSWGPRHCSVWPVPSKSPRARVRACIHLPPTHSQAGHRWESSQLRTGPRMSLKEREGCPHWPRTLVSQPCSVGAMGSVWRMGLIMGRDIPAPRDVSSQRVLPGDLDRGPPGPGWLGTGACWWTRPGCPPGACSWMGIEKERVPTETGGRAAQTGQPGARRCGLSIPRPLSLSASPAPSGRGQGEDRTKKAWTPAPAPPGPCPSPPRSPRW